MPSLWGGVGAAVAFVFFVRTSADFVELAAGVAIGFFASLAACLGIWSLSYFADSLFLAKSFYLNNSLALEGSAGTLSGSDLTLVLVWVGEATSPAF
jgi:hypothetical protein